MKIKSTDLARAQDLYHSVIKAMEYVYEMVSKRHPEPDPALGMWEWTTWADAHTQALNDAGWQYIANARHDAETRLISALRDLLDQKMEDGPLGTACWHARFLDAETYADRCLALNLALSIEAEEE